MFLEICMQIYSMVFAISRQINKQKYAKTVNLLCAGNKVFVKSQAQGWGLTPKTPLRTPLCATNVNQRQKREIAATLVFVCTSH